MKPYRHIIWDWNGTLLDDPRQVVEILNTILARRKQPPVTLEQYRAEFDFPVIAYYRKLGFDFEADPFDAICEEYHVIYRQKQLACRLHDGAVEVLQSLIDQGRTHSILSAYQQQMLHEVVEHFGLTQYFEHIFGLNDYYAHSKVDSGRMLLEQLDHKPSEILFVGDTSHDWHVAGQMGVDCVLIANGHQSRDRLEQCGVNILDSIDQLPSYLKK